MIFFTQNGRFLRIVIYSKKPFRLGNRYLCSSNENVGTLECRRDAEPGNLQINLTSNCAYTDCQQNL